MINKPEILIVDKPTAGLDPEERIKMRNFLKKYSNERTVILSTHIVEDISTICETVIIISLGKLLYHGRVDELVNQSPNAYEIKCNVDQIDEFKKKGTITDIKHLNNHCLINIVTQEPDFKFERILEKSLETAYMYLLKNKGENSVLV